jgi:excinuclease UvrABC nuclease subunit
VSIVSRVRPDAVALLPSEPGVYRFRDAQGRALYLGRAGDLRKRVGSYWGELRDRKHLRRMIPQIAAIEALVLASEHEAAWAERMLLEHRKARWNRVAGGLENPVYVRVEVAVPRISVAHEVAEAMGVRWYGPYLGGTATRLAVAGLERIYPMSYARSHLTGTERDLARIHGVETADAGALVDAVDAVLRRDPGAVAVARDSLVAKRDAAVSSELYEGAARIHEELGGLEWLVAPVRLFRTGADLVGVADGMQVTLRFRSGRLHTWEQSPVTPQAPAIPVDWTETLALNASLAAELSTRPVI